MSSPGERNERKSQTVGITSNGLLGSGLNIGTNKSPTGSPILIKSPKQTSKFAPADKITNSPTLLIKKTISSEQRERDMKELGKFSLNQPSQNSPKTPKKEKVTEIDPLTITGKNIPQRKNRNVLTNIDDVHKKSTFNNKSEYNDIVITKAVKRDSGSGSALVNLAKCEMDNVKNLLKTE